MAILKALVGGLASLLCFRSPQDKPRKRPWQRPYRPPSQQPSVSAYELEAWKLAEQREALRQSDALRLDEQQKALPLTPIEARKLAEQQKQKGLPLTPTEAQRLAEQQKALPVIPTQAQRPVEQRETPRPERQPRPESTIGQPRRSSRVSTYLSKEPDNLRKDNDLDQVLPRRDAAKSFTNPPFDSKIDPDSASTSTPEPSSTAKTPRKRRRQSSSLAKPPSQKSGPSPTPAIQPTSPLSTPPLTQTKSKGKRARDRLRESPGSPPTSPKRRRASVVEDNKDTHERQPDVGDELRQKATEERKLMDQCRTEAKEARQRWDRGLADHLYLEANAHKEKMLQWNKEACDLIFKENNRGRKPGVIDLHGLHVHEAIERTKDAVEAAVARQDPDIKLIVGKGNHSQDSVAKVKPGIEKWLSENGFTASLDRHGGMFIVVLGDQGSKTQLVEADLTQMSPSPMSEGDCDEYF